MIDMSIMTMFLKTGTIVSLVVIFYIMGLSMCGIHGLSDFCVGMISGLATMCVHMVIAVWIGD